MKTIIAGIAAAIAIAVSADVAAAQVAPRWTYDGSAVCPEGHDYRRGACMPRGYGGYRQSYGGYRESYGRGTHAVRPQWNAAGSAVCPNGFDYYRGLCRSR